MRPFHAFLVGFSALAAGALASSAGAQMSAARAWDEQMLAAIRIDKPRPPIHARNLYHVSAAMYDAWAAYDAHADQVLHHERATAVDVEAARAETISYAAYRLLRWRNAHSAGAAATTAALDSAFAAMGYDLNNVSTTGNTPAALGNRIYETIKAFGLNDGSNEVNDYAYNNGYAPVNDPLIFKFPGAVMNNPNRWQPLAFDYLVLQNGIVVGASIQSFIGPHWASVTPFSLTRTDASQPYFDPGPPPQTSDTQFKSEFASVILASGELDPNDGATVDISPGASHNNEVGTNSGTGYAVNPVTGLPYPPNVVKRGDYARVLAEFFADGPSSETPPGHWNVIANKVSDDPLAVFRIGGTGPVVNRLEWDVKTYLAVNGAAHDAAVSCWGIKGKYDSVRPISAIRRTCGMGQCSDPAQPSYNPEGMILVPGLIEVITAASSAPGERHEALGTFIGEVAIRAWVGQPPNPPSPPTQAYGVGWIRAATWMPYQKNTFVTPPFAGYTSGHSTYSRAAAEALAGITGSPYFPGGLGTYDFPANAFLKFEIGPSQNMQLQWATYYDAADDAGISRIYGGIHISSDDLTGRRNGEVVGKLVWAKSQKYFQGRITCPADFDGSGSLSVGDILSFIAAWFNATATGPVGSVADFNEDGAVNVQDIFAFLNSWFVGCQ